MQKTNAMRRLDAAKIPYEVLEYVVDENDLGCTYCQAVEFFTRKNVQNTCCKGR